MKGLFVRKECTSKICRGRVISWKIMVFEISVIFFFRIEVVCPSFKEMLVTYPVILGSLAVS